MKNRGAILNDFRQRNAGQGTPENVAICQTAMRYGVKPETVRRLVHQRRKDKARRITYRTRKSRDYPGMTEVTIQTNGAPIKWHTKENKEGIEQLVNRYRERIAT